MMTEQRKSEITKEARRRLDLWLQNDTIENMTVYGSFIRFNMGLGLLGGYPFVEPTWMVDKGFDGFVTEEEWDDPDYDEILYGLYDEAMKIMKP